MNKELKKILLFGNPNVGKSAIFSRLTGAKVTISNYPGTTVGFTQGYMKLFDDKQGLLIDVPGIYNVKPICKADEVAVNMISDGDLIINVLDATNLERNLFLTLELKENKVPMIVALNMWDETKHKGVELNVDKLEEELGIPVVPVCGITGYGIKHLVERFPEAIQKSFDKSNIEQKWEEIGRILDLCQKLHNHRHTFLERLEDISTKPSTGLPIAIGVVIVSFLFIRIIAESMISYIFDPLFNNFWIPVLNKLSVFFGGTGLLHEILIGHLVQGKIEMGESFGLLTTGLYVPLAAVLPYIVSFYLILGILEDLGYLPRLATQVDNLFHRLGLHGYAIVPMILGLGCNVPGAMAIRLLENRREKFIAATLMAIAVPCMAQTAMVVGLLGQRGGRYVALIFFILFTIMVVKGLILNKVLKGKSPEILWEIPPYRMPQLSHVLKKLWMRVLGFLKEAVPVVLVGVLFINFLYALNVFNLLANLFAPVLTSLWGLPKETVSSMIMGFLRKDVAVGMLAPLNLTTKQLIISCTILSVYFPCVATFIVMMKELGVRDMIKSAALMLLTALIVGSILNLVL